jgi:hypothetical protein
MLHFLTHHFIFPSVYYKTIVRKINKETLVDYGSGTALCFIKIKKTQRIMGAVVLSRNL